MLETTRLMEGRQRRLAVTLSVMVAGVCGAAALTCAAWAFGSRSPEAPEEAVAAALLWLGAALFARLTVVCATAARDLHTMGPAAVTVAPAARESLVATTGSSRFPDRTRRRVAGFFLTIATALIAVPSSAHAAPSSSTSTATARSITVAAPAAPAAPVPGFTAPAGVEPSTTPTLDVTSPPSRTDSRPSEAEPPVATQIECDAPQPGWTPGVLPPSPEACRLLTSGVRDAPPPTTHVVVRGQTLWSIAAAHLPPDASVYDVAEAVTRWLRANPAFADHPDRLFPGDELRIPGAETLQETK